MVNINEFKEYMKEQLTYDRSRRSIKVEGSTIDEALLSASVELGIPKFSLEYEVLQACSKGFLGIGKQGCILLVYKRDKRRGGSSDAVVDDDLDFYANIVINENGYYTIKLGDNGVELLVAPPVGTGRPSGFQEVINGLKYSGALNYSTDNIKKIVKEQRGEFIRVGDFTHIPENDASMNMAVSSDEMFVDMYATKPGPGGRSITKEEIMDDLEDGEIDFGIALDKIDAFIKHPKYDENYTIAEGQIVKNGEDGKLIYSFKQTTDIDLKQDKDGRINFKELNRFTNVTTGQPLATVKPPGEGIDGRTVYGRYITAINGKEAEINLGKNVSMIDEKTVIADACGQVFLIKDQISVETILVIPGAVNSETGNITSLGSVLVKGNVEDGFTVSAQANIEIDGYVGKSSLTAGGDIVVKQGANGGYGATISAGGNVWASFITNSRVDAGDRVIVSDGIVNSNVDASKKILCKGKRAKIVGGHLRAGQEINAAVLGTSGGTETIVEVGFAPKSKGELDKLEDEYKVLHDKLEEEAKNLRVLARLKKQNKILPRDKEESLKKFKMEFKLLTQQIKELTAEIEEKKTYLENLSVDGSIGASEKVFTGVKIKIEDKEYEVKNMFNKSVSFILDPEGYIVSKDYEGIKEDIDRRELNADNPT